MTMTIGPCLAFCARHIDEVESLSDLLEAGNLKQSPELVLFEDVLARANLEAGRLVTLCWRECKSTLSAAGARFDPKLESDRADDAEQRWDAYGYFGLDKNPERKANAFAGVGLFEGGGKLWFVPYVGIKDLTDEMAVDLGDGLRNKCSTIEPQPPWWDDESGRVVPLRFVEIRDDSRPDDLREIARQVFAQVSPHFAVIVKRTESAE